MTHKLCVNLLPIKKHSPQQLSFPIAPEEGGSDPSALGPRGGLRQGGTSLLHAEEGVLSPVL